MIGKSRPFIRYVWKTPEYRYKALGAICVVLTWIASNLFAYSTEGDLSEYEILQRELIHLESVRTQWKVYENLLLQLSDTIPSPEELSPRFYQLASMINAIQCRIDVIPQDSTLLSIPYKKFRDDEARMMSINYGASVDVVAEVLSRFSFYEKEYYRISADSNHLVKWTNSRRFRNWIQLMFAALYFLSTLLIALGFYFKHEPEVGLMENKVGRHNEI